MTPLRSKAAPRVYGLMLVAAVPLLALAVHLYQKPGQQNYAYLFAACALAGFLNIASIRFSFDGQTIRYFSLMTRTVIQMSEVTGAKIGYSESKGNNAFFFISTAKRGDLLLNLYLLPDRDAAYFCECLMALGIYPEVANGKRSLYLAKRFYPNGWAQPEEEE
ncbi:hypothetical protein [Prosthecobacter sp.]|uniref:hypothetical protein n=1 Tax=Prosthecobacter sp. TaxID=1965333 RepID=UPI001DD7055F|nr:hypothetical protein [Prosthecobacter sp.]MCB1276794.1 hypothetical protein [Prosthecobacter sp.]